MIFMLQNVNDGNVSYLINKKQFLVGRKDCDILIQNDQSISRKHAIIRVKGDKVTVEDCGSKYRSKYKGEALEPNVETELSFGENIQFGICNSVYSFQKFEFVTTGTLLNVDIKKQLISDLAALNGKYMDQWTPDSTHLTVEEVTLTLKYLHALMDEKPVVKPSYWTKFVERLSKNLPPPNIELYNKPRMAEGLVNKVDLKLNPKRKSLFKGKLFIFPKEKDKKKMEDIIKKAGGTSISWEKNPLPLQDIKSSPKEFLIIQTTEPTEDPTLNKVIEEFSKQGKRTIPLQEIAMSIVFCSCEKDCNPSYNRIEQVFQVPGPSEPSQKNALVENTQSQYFVQMQCKTEKKDEASVIEDTFECKLGESGPFETPSSTSQIACKKESSQILKRQNKDELQGTPSKKTKVESSKDGTKIEQKDNFLVKKTPSKRPIEDDNSDKQKENESQKSNAFDFLKRSKINKSQPSTSRDNPFKIIKRENDNVQVINKDNPFASGSKKRSNTEEPSTSSSVKRKKSNSPRNIFSSTNNESSLSRISGLSEISRVKHPVNGSWTTKNGTTIEKSAKENFEDYLDMEMKKFAEQFKDVVVVEILDMDKINLKPKLLRDPGNAVANGRANFKIFKKVMPLRPQRIIISRDSFHAVCPGDITDTIDTGRTFHDSDDEPESTQKTSKKLPKKFVI